MNRPIESEVLFNHLVSISSTIICTDGGANRLKKYSTEIMPDYIVGDFDSLSTETMEFYKEKNCQFVKTIDQNKNDMHKSIDFALALYPEIVNKKIFVHGAFGGRID